MSGLMKTKRYAKVLQKVKIEKLRFTKISG